MHETLKDVSGNLLKDKLGDLIPISLEIFNETLQKNNPQSQKFKPLTAEEGEKRNEESRQRKKRRDEEKRREENR